MTDSKTSVTVEELINNARLKILQGAEYIDRPIVTGNICRPALPFAGYFTHYPAERIQLLGITENAFADEVDHEKLAEYCERMCCEETPCFVITSDLPILPELKAAAAKANIPILGTHLTSSRAIGNMSAYLWSQLTPRESVHGVLGDINGTGVMLTGDSGVGKSETALELIRRGHRLVADDRVEVYARDERDLVGSAPAILKHMMEIRGIGIIDVMTLFGTGAVLDEDEVDLIIHLESWSPDKKFDRLGHRGDTRTIQDIAVPQISLPVKSGRNLAIIIESAAMNFRAQNMGYDATTTFDNNLHQLIKQNSKGN